MIRKTRKYTRLKDPAEVLKPGAKRTLYNQNNDNRQAAK